MFKPRICAAVLACVVATACASTPTPQVTDDRITNYDNATRLAGVTLNPALEDSAQITCHTDFPRTDLGLKNLCVALQRQTSGDFRGRTFVGLYLTDTGTGAAQIKAYAYISDQPVIISDITKKQHLLLLCRDRPCVVQPFTSATPTVFFPGVYATFYVMEGGTGLVGVRRTAEGKCEVTVADHANGPLREYFGMSEVTPPRVQVVIADGEEFTLPGINKTVRCRQVTADRSSAAALAFLDAATR